MLLLAVVSCDGVTASRCPRREVPVNFWLMIFLRLVLCGVPLLVNAVIGLDRMFGSTFYVELCLRERSGWLKDDLASRFQNQLVILLLCTIPITAFAFFNEAYGGEGKDYSDSVSCWILALLAIAINALTIGWNAWRIICMIPVQAPYSE